jgi:hypothetical protein
VGRDGKRYTADLPFCKREIFFYLGARRYFCESEVTCPDFARADPVLAPNQPSLAAREGCRAGAQRRRRLTRPASYASASKNIENNPMQRKEPLENKGPPAWMIQPQKTF